MEGWSYLKRYLGIYFRKKYRDIKKRVSKRAYTIAMVGVALAAVLTLWGVVSAVNGRKAVNTDADTLDNKLEERTEEGVKKLEEEKVQIKLAIAADTKYGQQLAELYKQYPQTKKLLLNREAYPDWLVEYFLTHEEAVDWVIDYPEYAGKTAEEIAASVPQTAEPEEYFYQNGIPLYLQWDKTWGYASYGSGVIAVDGCGPTCLAMVVSGMTGDVTMTPKKVADFSVENGYFSEGAGTSWSLMEEGAKKLGIQSRQIEKWSASEVISELQAGHPMICSMGPGDFTNQGHFIVLCGVTEDGKVILNDPNSRINSRKEWDVQKLLDQMKGMWAFSL